MVAFYGEQVSSRLLIGTALYPSPAIMQQAIRASGADLVTVSVRRETAGGKTGDAFWSLIRERVAVLFGVSVEALSSKKRTKEVTMPRQVAMYLIRELLDLPLVEIGRLFGGRDHSTVIHSIQKVEEDLAADDAFHARVQARGNAL